MNGTGERRQWALITLIVLAAAMIIFIALVTWSARDLYSRSGNPGYINLSDVKLDIDGNRLLLDAEAEVVLPPTIVSGLNSGVSLSFILSLKVAEPKDYWFDTQLAEFERHFTLTYYELTRHYRVHAVESGISRHYRSLSSALRGLGSFQGLSLSGNNRLPSGVSKSLAMKLRNGGLYGMLRFRLDSRSLPLPLQPLITSNWRLVSEEHLWVID